MPSHALAQCLYPVLGMNGIAPMTVLSSFPLLKCDKALANLKVRLAKANPEQSR
jgi:hypothetical protein